MIVVMTRMMVMVTVMVKIGVNVRLVSLMLLMVVTGRIMRVVMVTVPPASR